MANVTFSSPVMAKDLTVYSVAGHRGTLLALAKEFKIPIPFDCQDGDCGSCLIEVKHLSHSTRCGIALTEKEKELLKQLGKITKEEIMDAEVNDMPPRYRLACQYFVRNEDIIVAFEGDQTLPAKRPKLTIAAPIYKGGLEIKSLDEFLSYAVKVEEDAAIHFERLAEQTQSAGNQEVADLFRQLGGYSRLHLEEAKKRARSFNPDVNVPANYAWPDNQTPEQTDLWAGDASMTRLAALKAALVGERRGFEFYYSVAETTTDPEIRELAKEFVKEESEHVETLRRWIEREEYVQSAASAKTEEARR